MKSLTSSETVCRSSGLSFNPPMIVDESLLP